MADVLVRKTRKGKRYYARGYLDLDAAGNLRRTSRLILVDAQGLPIQSLTHARAEADRLEQEAEARAERRRLGIPEPEPAHKKPPLTLAELAERFFQEYQGERVKDRAAYMQDARSLLRTHVLPALGHRLAAEIQPADLARVRDGMLAAGKAKMTVLNVLRRVGRLYAWADELGYLDCPNPVQRVKKPSARDSREVDFWTQDEMRSLFERAAAHELPQMLPALAICAYTGCRKGEMFGLTWPDVDFERRAVCIRRSYDKLPKNGRVKVLPLHPHLEAILRDWKPRCPETPDELVIPLPHLDRRGRPLGWRMGAEWDLTDEFKALLEAADCHLPRRHRWHALRHTVASHVAAGGASERHLMELGGWTQPDMVSRYAHLNVEHLRPVLAALDFAPRPPAGVSSLAEARRERATGERGYGVDTESPRERGSDKIGYGMDTGAHGKGGKVS